MERGQLRMSLRLTRKRRAGGGEPTAAPANTALPVISGVQTVGQTLSVSGGSWDQPVASRAYQWENAGVAISGATAQTYVIQAGDAGDAITCTVTATNSLGSGEATSEAVTPAAALEISGTPSETATIGNAYSFTPSTSGGHELYSYALTGTLPGGLSFDDETGAISGTPTTEETASGLDITVTDADGLTASLGVFSIAVSATTPLVAPYYDDFAGAALTITGRAVGDKAWAAVQSVVTNANPIITDGAGKLVGQQGSASNYIMVELDTGLSDGKWYRAEMNANPTAAATFNTAGNTRGAFNINASHISGANWSRILYAAVSGISYVGYLVNGDLRTTITGELLFTNDDAQGKGVYAEDGDVYELRKKTVGGSILVEPYYNGQRIGPDLDITSLGVAINDKFAIRGDVPSTKQWDAVMVGDPAAHAMLSVYAPRIVQQDADGGFTLYLQGDYTRAAPSGLTVTLYDKATDAAIDGYVDAPVASFATGAAKTESSDGSWTGELSVAGGVVAATGAYVVASRTDVTTQARSGVFRPGDVVALYGQSLAVKGWADSHGQTFTAPAQAYTVDGMIDNNGASTTFPVLPVNRKTRPINGSLESGFCTAWMAYTLNQIAGATKPQAYIRAGYGATYYYQRRPDDPTNTGIWAALADGIRLAGNDLAYVFDAGGEYEAVGAPSSIGDGYTLSAFGSTEQAALIGHIQAIYDGIEAITGRPVKVIMRPVGTIWTGTNARVEAMRRLQWKLTQDYPDRYVLGGYINELQHTTSTDQYHLAVSHEQGRRMEYALAKLMGLTTDDRSGPKLHSVTAWSDASVTVRFDKNGASALEVVNTETAVTDYRGGLTFATDSGFAAEKVPTAVGAPSDVDSAYAEITWTFDAGSFATAPYVRGPYGAEPFNRSGNVTARGAMATNASMVRGVFTGELYNIPVQPYYSAAGDYIVGA